MFAALIVLLANFGLIVGEFVGISSAMALFGVSRYLSVGLSAFLICYLVIAGSYNRVEKIFMGMAAVFLTYIISAFIAHPNPAEIARGMFVPTLRMDPGYITLMVALIGTTISPYQQVFQQSAVVERGIPRHHYAPERWGDPPLDEAPHERSFGLWRADGSAKPAVPVVTAAAGGSRVAPPDDAWIDLGPEAFWGRPGLELPRLYARYRAASAAG
jgi:Mn2+/Fe2+ NRAMP family transporter